MSADLVFLLDVDNTLLDGDRIVDDLHRELQRTLGPVHATRYWDIFAAVRRELGYVDYLGTLQILRRELELAHVDPQRVLTVSGFLIDYPFADRLYPRALDVLAHLARFGPTVLLTDGDAVFQPRKLKRSGLHDAVQGRALVYIHKEQMLAEVEHHYPARHYVMIDDKLNLLTAIKAVWQDRVTTIFPRQGHYAADATTLAANPAADFSIATISELADVDLSPLLSERSEAAALQD